MQKELKFIGKFNVTLKKSKKLFGTTFPFTPLPLKYLCGAKLRLFGTTRNFHGGGCGAEQPQYGTTQNFHGGGCGAEQLQFGTTQILWGEVVGGSGGYRGGRWGRAIPPGPPRPSPKIVENERPGASQASKNFQLYDHINVQISLLFQYNSFFTKTLYHYTFDCPVILTIPIYTLCKANPQINLNWKQSKHVKLSFAPLTYSFCQEFMSSFSLLCRFFQTSTIRIIFSVSRRVFRIQYMGGGEMSQYHFFPHLIKGDIHH